jgi:hypothetical protein
MQRRRPIKLVDHEHIARFEAFLGNADAECFVANENVYFELRGKLFVLAGLYSFPLRSVGKYLVNDASNLVALRVKNETWRKGWCIIISSPR